MTGAAPSVTELARTLGIDQDLAGLVDWARARADALVGAGLDEELSGLLDPSLARGEGSTPPRPASSADAPPVPEDPPADEGEELEELDVAELEELDMAELEVFEDEGGPLEDFVDRPSSAEDAGPVYAPTDTQPLEPVDAEIVDDDEGSEGAEGADEGGDFDRLDEATAAAPPVRTGDTATQMSREEVLGGGGDVGDEGQDHGQGGEPRVAPAPEAPEQVSDEESGDLFDDDELDIDIDV